MLSELDGIAVRIRHPGEAEIGEEVVRGAERGRTGGSQARVVSIGVVGPENDLDWSSTEVWIQPMIGDRCVNRGDADGESVQGHLDVNWCTLLGCSECLAKANTFVETDEPHDVEGVDVDRRAPKHGHRGSITAT
jgi:hypothetical protein